MITRKRLLFFSLCQAVIGVMIFVFNYVFFHFVTDNGFTLTWHPEAGKPFVADLIGVLGTLFIFGAAVTLLAALIFFTKLESEEKK